MIVLNDEMCYINWYLTEKEYHLTKYVREALNMIDWLIRTKRKSKALSIHIVNEKFKSKYNFDFSKEFLWRAYNQRKAYIKNGKDKFKIWKHNKMLESIPDEMKVNLCACGCGLPVKPGNKYIHGHHVKNRSKEENNHYAKNMRNAKKARKEKVIFLKDRFN